MDVLRISTTPIQLSMSSQRARLESKIPDPEAGIINQPGRLEIRSENIKVNIDLAAPCKKAGAGSRNYGGTAHYDDIRIAGLFREQQRLQ